MTLPPAAASRSSGRRSAASGARFALLPAFQEVLPSAGETGGWYAAGLAALLDPEPSEH